MDFEVIVLAGIVRNPVLLHRVPNIGRACFTGLKRRLFSAMKKLGSRLSAHTISSELHGGAHDVKTVASLGPVLDTILNAKFSMSDWTYAVDKLLEKTRLRVMEARVKTAFDLVTKKRQAEAEGVLTVLPRELRMYRGRGRAAIQDFRKEAESILKDSYSGPRMMTKLSVLDEIIRGFRRGQLVLWGGFAHHAKTTISIYVAEQFLLQGHNVFFATLEMTAQQIGALFLTMHSHVVHDGGIPFLWFDDNEVYESLSESDRTKVKDVIDDFKTGGRAMGNLRICHPELNENALDIFDRADQYADEIGKPVDVVMIDYLEIMTPISQKPNTHDALRESLTHAKHYAKTSQSGQGTLVWTPWQIKRAGYTEAQKRGFYEMKDFAESAYAERASDVMGWNMFGESLVDHETMKIGVCKNRTTRKVCRRGFDVAVNDETCMFRDLDEVEASCVLADDLE
jgi:replicative DNA helicase